MKTVKWLVLLSTLIVVVMPLGQNVTNSCSTLGSLQPDQPEKCYRTSVSGNMCCFVSVKQGSTNTNFCASVPGSYLNPQAVVDLQTDIGSLYNITVNCYSQIYRLSLVAILLVIGLIFI